MSIELFLKKKQNPAQCKNTADLLGWFGLALALQKGYTVSTGWQMLLLVSLGCALWLFAVYIVRFSLDIPVQHSYRHLR